MPIPLRKVEHYRLRKVEHYRYLTNEFLRLAANDSSIESQNYYLQMAEHYGTLAETAELDTTPEADKPRLPLRQFLPNDGV
jgi:hypothetical protein